MNVNRLLVASDNRRNTPESIARGEYVLAREERRRQRAFEASKADVWPPPRHPEDDEIEAEMRSAFSYVYGSLAESPSIGFDLEIERGDEMTTSSVGSGSIVTVTRESVENELLKGEIGRLREELKSANDRRETAEKLVVEVRLQSKWDLDRERTNGSKVMEGWSAAAEFRAKFENADIARLKSERDAAVDARAEACRERDAALKNLSEEKARREDAEKVMNSKVREVEALRDDIRDAAKRVLDLQEQIEGHGKEMEEMARIKNQRDEALEELAAVNSRAEEIKHELRLRGANPKRNAKPARRAR